MDPKTFDEFIEQKCKSCCEAQKCNKTIIQSREGIKCVEE